MGVELKSSSGAGSLKPVLETCACPGCCRSRVPLLRVSRAVELPGLSPAAWSCLRSASLQTVLGLLRGPL